ncbi:hypothetical protein [Bradyrhizobium sp. NP1]|nr:hypothetical protein [Bradyrhizobium sp. NP1]WJR79121.1 hypothetical protein QOU61_04810 [Bradyrhizobium sp. NP1]
MNARKPVVVPTIATVALVALVVWTVAGPPPHAMRPDITHRTTHPAK